MHDSSERDWVSARAPACPRQPDAYSFNGVRGPNYTYSDYVTEFKLYATALQSVRGCPLIQGGTYDTPFDAYTQELPDYVAHFQPCGCPLGGGVRRFSRLTRIHVRVLGRWGAGKGGG